MKRQGRLNLTQFLENGTVKKTAVIKEESRPYRLRREAWALRLAKSHGLNVPKVLDYFLDSNSNEVLILEKIDGTTLDKKNVKIRGKALGLIGQQMMRLSNVCKKYGWIDPDKLTGTHETWKSFLLSFAQTYGKRLAENNLLSKKRLEIVVNKTNNLNLNLTSPYLIHRDIKFRNIIRSSSGNIWIIDWENAILGDPLFELAVFSARNGRNNFWRKLSEGYNLKTQLLKYSSYDLYESLALIGLVSFLNKHSLCFKDKLENLNKLIDKDI